MSARRSFFQVPMALFTLPACLQMLDLMRMPGGTRIQDAAKEALFTRYIEALPQVCCPLPFVLKTALCSGGRHRHPLVNLASGRLIRYLPAPSGPTASP